MVGFFQIFGISFIIWTFAGLLRFIFERLELLIGTERAPSRSRLLLSSGIGASASLSLFLFFIFLSDLQNSVQTIGSAPRESIAVAIFWMIAIVIGAYSAVRIYSHAPRLVALIGGIGAMLFLAFFFPAAHNSFTPETRLYFSFLLTAITLLAATLGGYAGKLVNAAIAIRQANIRALISPISASDVAIVIAAHNESLTIRHTIESLAVIADKKDMYIGSDGSTDSTVEVVRALGCNVLDIQPNRGKARALTYTLEENDIFSRYKAVFFLDADLTIDKNFFTYALPQFDDKEVVAVVGHAVSHWPRHFVPRWRLFFTAYRVRLWRILQYCLRYGQTWKYANVSPIVPGGGSIYRTEALRHIDIQVPGLVIEDFNMTFSIHHQNLGRITYDPRAIVVDQEPYLLRDYVKQIKRWYVGYFQTLRHHGFWPSFFFFTTAAFTFEMLISSIAFLLAPFFALALLFGGVLSLPLWSPFQVIEITLVSLTVTTLVIDYIVTCIVAVIENKPLLLIYGIGFVFLRYIEAAIFLHAMFMGLLIPPKADGRWISPKRMSYGG